MNLVPRAPFLIRAEDEKFYILSTVQMVDGEIRSINVRAAKSLRDFVSGLISPSSTTAQKAKPLSAVTQPAQVHAPKKSNVPSRPMEQKTSVPPKVVKRAKSRKEHTPPNLPKPNKRVEIKSSMKAAFEKFFGVELD